MTTNQCQECDGDGHIECPDCEGEGVVDVDAPCPGCGSEFARIDHIEDRAGRPLAVCTDCRHPWAMCPTCSDFKLGRVRCPACQRTHDVDLVLREMAWHGLEGNVCEATNYLRQAETLATARPCTLYEALTVVLTQASEAAPQRKEGP
jgi:RecJ-like exonuclease